MMSSWSWLTAAPTRYRPIACDRAAGSIVPPSRSRTAADHCGFDVKFVDELVDEPDPPDPPPEPTPDRSPMPLSVASVASAGAGAAAAAAWRRRHHTTPTTTTD